MFLGRKLSITGLRYWSVLTPQFEMRVQADQLVFCSLGALRLGFHRSFWMFPCFLTLRSSRQTPRNDLWRIFQHSGRPGTDLLPTSRCPAGRQRLTGCRKLRLFRYSAIQVRSFDTTPSRIHDRFRFPGNRVGISRLIVASLRERFHRR